MLATPFAEGAGFFRTAPGLDQPDAQMHFVIGVVDNHARKLHCGPWLLPAMSARSILIRAGASSSKAPIRSRRRGSTRASCATAATSKP